MTRRTKLLAGAAALALIGTIGFVATSTAQRAFARFGGGGFAGGFIAQELVRDLDADRDGRITQAEIDRAVAGRLERFDADKNGRLSLDEFTVLFADLTRPIAVRAFQFMDPDGDAAVTKSELDERFSRVVARFDRNGDGALSVEDRRFGGSGRGDGPDDPGRRDRP